MQTNIYLPTLEECEYHVKRNDSFYCNDMVVNGYNVKIFNYRLAQFNDFYVDSDMNAFELRGITFIQDKKGWNRFPALTKFFNLNQNQGWMLDDVNEKKAVRVQDKADGSLVTFVKFPDGLILPKTKQSFDNDQCKMALEIFENNYDIRSLVRRSFEENFTVIFELVSPFNQIVLPYEKTELRILQIRDSITGRYFTLEEMNTLDPDMKLTFTEDFSVKDNALETLLELKETAEEVEGWVVTLEDGQMLKIKTKWYLDRHHLISEIRENDIIASIVNEEIDDIITVVTGEKLDQINSITEIVIKKFNELVLEYKDLRWKYFNLYNEDRKKFAIENKNTRMFPYLMRTVNEPFSLVNEVSKNCVKDYILRSTTKLSDAKEFLK